MKNKHCIVAFCTWLVPVALTWAQPIQPVGETPLDLKYLRDYAETRGFMLGRPAQPKPTPDGKAVLFLRAQPRVPKLSLYEFDVATRRTRELMTPEKLLKGAEENLSPEEKARRERQRVSVRGFTDFQLSDDGGLVLLPLSGKLYVVRRSDGSVHELATGPGTIVDPRFSPDGRSVAYVRNYDVHVYDLATRKERAITIGGTAKKSHGLAEFVAQEEMFRYSGYWWSPDSKFIAYQESDAEGVEVWHVADPARPEQAPTPQFYPRPGKANVKVRLGVVPVTGGQTVWINWDASKYPYMASVTWQKPGPLTLVVQTRLQDELVVLKADAITGKTTALLAEKAGTFFNLYQDVPRWVKGKDGKLAFWWIGQSGMEPQLERHVPETGEKFVLPNQGRVQRLLRATDSEVVFQTCDDPTCCEVVFQPCSGSDAGVFVNREKHGWTAVALGDQTDIYVATTTTVDKMPTSMVFKKGATSIGPLPSVAESPPFTPKVEIMKVGEGEGFYAAVVRPHGFDPKKRYPVIVDVYGGPHHQQVTRQMRSWLLDQWLADQGFIVVAIDGRGSSNRGLAWDRAIYKKFGSVPLEDQVAGLKALAAKVPQMDMERVGITGWSFGGYLSALAVMKRPDVFKAGVAGAPVVDWLDYDTHYTERYLGLPDTDAAAYKEASLLTYAADLKRPLLIVHGTTDDNVFFRHSLRLADAFFRSGKDFDMLPLSGLTHMVPDPVVTQQLHARTARFFQTHLGKPSAVILPAP